MQKRDILRIERETNTRRNDLRRAFNLRAGATKRKRKVARKDRLTKNKKLKTDCLCDAEWKHNKKTYKHCDAKTEDDEGKRWCKVSPDGCEGWGYCEPSSSKKRKPTGKGHKYDPYYEVYLSHFKNYFDKLVEADTWRFKESGRPNYKEAPKMKKNKKGFYKLGYRFDFVSPSVFGRWRPVEFYEMLHELKAFSIGASLIRRINADCAMACLKYMLKRHTTEERVPIYPEVVTALGFCFEKIGDGMLKKGKNVLNKHYLFLGEDVSSDVRKLPEVTAAVKVSDCSNLGKVVVELLGSRGQRIFRTGRSFVPYQEGKGEKEESRQLFGIVQCEWLNKEKWTRGSYGEYPFRSVYPGFLKINDNYKYKYYKEKPRD